MKIRPATTVRQLIRELEKLDPDRLIFVGDCDKYGRYDMNIASILRKSIGFDDDREFYYVIASGAHEGGCLPY